MSRTLRSIVGLGLTLLIGASIFGCAGSSKPPVRPGDGGVRDGSLDGGADGAIDLGPVDVDAGPDLGPTTRVGTCESCETSADCYPSSYCALLTTGGRACLPSCNPDLPMCPAGLNCTLSAALEVDEYVCAPLGGLCCVDEDRDTYGQGIGCVGPDCDDANADINPAEPERCNGIDDNCDLAVDGTMTDCVTGICRPNAGMPGTYEDIRAAMCTDATCTSGTLTSCGLFNCELGMGLGSRCALTCPSTATDNTGNELCVDAAHCDGTACLTDQPNGGVCDEDSDCSAGHCDNGFCCASGQCCSVAMDCSGGTGSVCETPLTCQGTRGDITCVSNICVVASGVPDDSACDSGTIARDCGLFLPVYCSGAAAQTAPACATSCTTDAGCIATGHCEVGVCAPDRPPGGSCSRVQDCQDGNSCVDGVCCMTACSGQCERCNAPGTAGTCTPVGGGQDPDLECPGFSCSDYYAGFDGLGACHRRAPISNDAAVCNGARACLTPAELCAVSPAGTEVQIDCDDVCQSATAGTCNGTMPGACTDSPPGSQTCGFGACMTTSPRCNAGTQVTCIAGMSSPEACNGIDDDCAGGVDNAPVVSMCPATANVATTSCGGSAGCSIGTCNPNAVDIDGAYANGCECVNEGNGSTCGSATSLGAIGVGGSANTLTSSVAASGASDYFYVTFPATGSPGGGTPHVRFTRNDGSIFRFEITGACSAAALPCGSGGVATDRDDWSFVDNQATPGPNQWNLRNTPWPAAVYVRVYRTTSGASCSQYQLTITR